MEREIRDETLQGAFAARETNRPLERERGLENAIGDLFRHDVIDPNHETKRSRGGSMLERFHQVLSQPEYFVGIAEHEPSHFGRHERPPRFREKLLPEPLLERAQLHADRRGPRATVPGRHA